MVENLNVQLINVVDGLMLMQGQQKRRFFFDQE
jgi:hypothetical protein